MRVHRRHRRFAAAAHLAEADEAVVGLDLDDRADESAPMAAVRVPQRRLEWHGHGCRADVGNLHRDRTYHGAAEPSG